ncbi:hypothetical protein SUGI_0547240 [Cryptomeria japonica]|uniref:ankyrin repeat-containing protein ITN1-like n=1 Tax=Cryptomeria japonica TaxID=3369 RepID=UPI0024089421|nr:ankyrin repeat-containing protein ITN1-like [Cryptomeria japonica]GLJ27878.1 hypothetical protein SUGI_0547240 [Cryptomeria japonica]
MQLVDLLLSPPDVDVNALNDEGMTALDIASAAPQDNPNSAHIIRRLRDIGASRSGVVPKSSTKSDGSKKEIDSDTVNTHMVVASLIATVTFAAIFQIPGGIEDDKDSIHYGAAKLAFSKALRLFLFSNTAAFTSSLTVVAGWLLRQNLKYRYLGNSLIHILSESSEGCLLVSIFWTVVAFVSATITVIMPRNIDSLKSKDIKAFSNYERLWRYEISLTTFIPFCVAFMCLAMLSVFREKKLSISKPNTSVLFSVYVVIHMILVVAFTLYE